MSDKRIVFTEMPMTIDRLGAAKDLADAWRESKVKQSIAASMDHEPSIVCGCDVCLLIFTTSC